MEKHSVPILFLVFNRPEFTQRVFAVIREQKPHFLYVAADGPRKNEAAEIELCNKVREIVSQIDWDCEIRTLFRNENLGCKEAVSTALDWFFSQVDEGIILEDDCLPDPTFFSFCAELLDRYRDDTRVMSVSGSNLLGFPWKNDTQSYFWGHGGIWGWATWKRAWNFYDIKMAGWEEKKIKEKIKDAMRNRQWFDFYHSMFESSFNGSLDTWDIQWFYAILINDGLAINPSVNLVKNIGFEAGTHTNSTDNHLIDLSLNAMSFPLKHPVHRDVDLEYLTLTIREMTKKSARNDSFLEKIFRNLTRILPIR